MTSPDGETVATLKVGLEPDGTGFRQKTNAIVESTEESIDEIDVRVMPELTGFPELMAQLATIQALRIDIPAQVELAGIDDLIADVLVAKASAEALSNIPIEFDADRLDGVFRDLAQQFRQLADSTGQDLRPTFKKSIMDAWNESAKDLDFTQFASSVARQIENDLRVRPPSMPSLNFDNLFKDLGDDIGVFRLDVKPQLDVLALANVVRQIATVTRTRVVQILPFVNNAAVRAAGTQLARLSGARVATDEIDRMYRAFQNLDRALPIISVLTTAIVGLIGWLGTGVSNVFALGASLAQIAPLALALPALFAGAAIGMGIMVAAFKDFNTIFPGVSGQLSALQDRISANFWASATDGVRAFLDAPWQTFQEGVAATSVGLGKLVGQFAGDLASSLNLAPMFDNLNAGIAILGGATAPLANIIQILGEAGSTVIPILSEKLVGLANTFSSFLSEQGVGGLAAMFETAVFQAGELFRALGGLGNILAGIANAASAGGGSTLTVLADTLDRVAAVVNGPAFQGVLIDFFSAAHQAMSNIATFAGPAVEQMFLTLAQTLTTILPLVGTTIGIVFGQIATALSNPALQEGFIALVQGISTGLTAIAPALTPIAAAFGELGGFIGALAANLGPVLGTVFTVLAESLSGILPALQPLIPILGGALIGAVTALAPVISQLATAFASVITNGALPAITTAIQALLPVVTMLAPIIANVLVTAFTALTPILPILATLFAQIATTLGAILAPILTALGPILELFIGVIVAVVGAISPLLTIALDLINAVLVPLLPVIMQLIQLALTPLLLAFQFLLPIIEILGKLLESVISGVILPIVMPIIQGLADLLTGILGPAIDSIGQVFSATWDFVKAIWDSFAALFRGDIDGFIEGIKGAFTGFRDRIKEIWDNLWSSVKDALRAAWDGIVSAVTTGIANVVSFFTGLPGQITSALGNLGNLLVQAGKNLIQGFLDGIKNMFGQVQNTLGNLTSFLPDWKGPADVDRTLLEKSGQLVIEGFIEGLESRYKAVQRSLGGLTSDMAKVPFNLPVSASLGGIDAALAANGGGGNRIINYYAAPGTGMSSEEELFAAAGRGRAWGF